MAARIGVDFKLDLYQLRCPDAGALKPVNTQNVFSGISFQKSRFDSGIRRLLLFIDGKIQPEGRLFAFQFQRITFQLKIRVLLCQRKIKVLRKTIKPAKNM